MIVNPLVRSERPVEVLGATIRRVTAVAGECTIVTDAGTFVRWPGRKWRGLPYWSVPGGPVEVPSVVEQLEHVRSFGTWPLTWPVRL